MDIITPVSHAFYAVFCATYYVFIFFSGVFGMYISYSIFETKFTEKGRKRVKEMISLAEEQRKMHESANKDCTNNESSENDSKDDDSTDDDSTDDDSTDDDSTDDDDEQKNSSPMGSDSKHKKTK